MKKNIVITGAAGFLGSHFIETLNTKEYNIFAIDKKKFKFDKIISLVFDLKNIDNFINKLPSKIDYLYHFASVKDIAICENDYDRAYHNNTYLTLKLIFQLKHKVKNIIFTSTCAVYGENIVPTKEEIQAQPISFYATSKLSAENYCLVFSKIFNINTIILRLFNLYGKWNKEDSYQGVIIKFLNRIQQVKSITIYGDGKQYRDFINVSDVCKILSLFLHKLPHISVLNVGTSKKTTINELFQLTQKVLGKKVRCYYTKPKEFEICKSLANNKRLLSYIGNNFSFTNLEEGLQNIIK